MPAPPAVLADGLTYYPAQLVVRDKLQTKNSLLVADTGCGKTLLGLSFAAAAPDEATLIVVPAAVIPQWMAERARFFPTLQSLQWSYHSGNGIERHGPCGVTFVHPQALVQRKARFNFSAYDRVVLDESHVYSNPKTLLTKTVLSLQAPHRLALTATPMCNRLSDIFSTFCWLAPTAGYRPWEQSRFERDYTTVTGLPDTHAFRDLLNMHAVFLSKQACQPEVPRLTIRVECLPGGRPLSETTPANARRRSWLRSEARDRSLLNFYNSPDDIPGVRSSRLVVCATHAQSDRCFRLMADQMTGLPGTIGTLDGRHPPGHQSGLANCFKRGRFDTLILGLRCAQSFSFEHCSRMWFGSLGYSASSFWQAVGRVWRVNSPHPVTVTVPWESGSIDERTFGILAEKLAIESEALPVAARSSDLISWEFVNSQPNGLTTTLERLSVVVDEQRTH